MADARRHLEGLRRYARALTGSVCSGEAAVRATLERFAEEAPASASNRVDRAALFQLLTGVLATRSDEPNAQSPADPGVSKRRQAFLLAALEGFSLVETARILGINESRVSELVEEGRRACEAPSVPALIIHDEPIVAMDLERILQDLGHRVIGIAGTRDKAVELAERGKPELVLARTILNGTKTGFAAVGDVLLVSPAAVVITTIFPHGLLTGMRSEPAFVLGMPFDWEQLGAITSQALFYHRLAQASGRPLDDEGLRAQVEAALVWLIPRGTLYSFSQRPVMPSVVEANAAAGTATVDLGACRFIEGSALGQHLELEVKRRVPALRSLGFRIREL